MKKRLLMSISVFVCLVALLATSASASVMTRPEFVTLDDQTEEGAELEAVIGEIRKALIEAQQNNVKGFPALAAVKISVNTVVAKSVSGGINFLVFTIGSKRETESASTLDLYMKPPPTSREGTGQAVSAENLKQALAKGLNLAKVAILNANNGTPPLITNKFEIEVKFTVKVEVSGGVKIVNILPIGLEGSGKLSQNKIHSIKLTFGA